MSYRDETEPSHYPHMERAMRPLTVVNGTQQTMWFPRRMDLPPLESHAAADEGGTFREPAPARIPRHRPLFKTDAEMRADGWEPATWRETALVLGVPLAILLVALGVWVWRTFA